MIAIDSAVLIELLSDGARADAVESCLRQALVGGRVVVCGTTLAESVGITPKRKGPAGASWSLAI